MVLVTRLYSMHLAKSSNLIEGVLVETTSFLFGGETLAGTFYKPSRPLGSACGVVIVVGGPQYRVGAHSQFVRLATSLARAGTPVLIFDLSGRGDSSGDALDYYLLNDQIYYCCELLRNTTHVTRVILFGLCDGATAAVLAAKGIPELQGLILVNPWLEDEQQFAQTKVQSYYLRRLTKPALWRDLVYGQLNLWSSAIGFMRTVTDALSFRTEVSPAPTPGMLTDAIDALPCDILITISGQDTTGQTFYRHVQRSAPALLTHLRIQWLSLDQADHTLTAENDEATWLRITSDFVAQLATDTPS